MDRGIRPYASSAKTYNEMMDEQTEQYYRSMNYDIKPSLKQPYCYGSYTEMMYLYSGGDKKSSDENQSMGYENIAPVVIATVTSPDYAFFDFFTEETSNILVDETFNNFDDWTITVVGSDVTYEISPAGEFHCLINDDSGFVPDYCNLLTSYTSTTTPNTQILEFEIKIVSANAAVSFKLKDVANFIMRFTQAGILVWDGSNYTQVGTVTPTINSYQNWKLVNTKVDGSTSSCELFLEGISQGTLSLAYALENPIADLYCSYQSSPATTLETYTRSIKLSYT